MRSFEKANHYCVDIGQIWAQAHTRQWTPIVLFFEAPPSPLTSLVSVLPNIFQLMLDMIFSPQKKQEAVNSN